MSNEPVSQIYKLQRPLSEDDGPLLAYDQHRTHSAMLDNTPAMRRLFGRRAKIYVRATMTPEGLTVLAVVPDCAW